jgi:hypothetical protein
MAKVQAGCRHHLKTPEGIAAVAEVLNIAAENIATENIAAEKGGNNGTNGSHDKTGKFIKSFGGPGKSGPKRGYLLRRLLEVQQNGQQPLKKSQKDYRARHRHKNKMKNAKLGAHTLDLEMLLKIEERIREKAQRYADGLPIFQVGDDGYNGGYD